MATEIALQTMLKSVNPITWPYIFSFQYQKLSTIYDIQQDQYIYHQIHIYAQNTVAMATWAYYRYHLTLSL